MKRRGRLSPQKLRSIGLAFTPILGKPLAGRPKEEPRRAGERLVSRRTGIINRIAGLGSLLRPVRAWEVFTAVTSSLTSALWPKTRFVQGTEDISRPQAAAWHRHLSRWGCSHDGEPCCECEDCWRRGSVIDSGSAPNPNLRPIHRFPDLLDGRDQNTPIRADSQLMVRLPNLSARSRPARAQFQQSSLPKTRRDHRRVVLGRVVRPAFHGRRCIARTLRVRCRESLLDPRP